MSSSLVPNSSSTSSSSIYSFPLKRPKVKECQPVKSVMTNGAIRPFLSTSIISSSERIGKFHSQSKGQIATTGEVEVNNCKRQKADSWVCRHCTFENTNGAFLTCEVCNELRTEGENEVKGSKEVKKGTSLSAQGSANDSSRLSHTSIVKSSSSSSRQVSAPSIAIELSSTPSNHFRRCKVCLDDVDMDNMLSLWYCNHWFCKDCFVQYSTSKITEGITSIRCPEQGCMHDITIDELNANLDLEIMKKYERFMMRNWGQKNGCVTCPSCSEWFVEVALRPEDIALWHSISCQLCKYDFCGKCGEKPHTSGKAQSDDIDCAELAARKVADADMQQLLSSSDIKQCPNCKHFAEKDSGGCNFIYCRCEKRFCFLCCQLLEDKDHYNHFKGRPGCVGPFGPVCVNTSDGKKATHYDLRKSKNTENECRSQNYYNIQRSRKAINSILVAARETYYSHLSLNKFYDTDTPAPAADSS